MCLTSGDTSLRVYATARSSTCDLLLEEYMLVMSELCEQIRRRNRSLPVPVSKDVVFVVRPLETGERPVRGVRAEQACARRLHRAEGAVTSRAAEAFRQRSLKAVVASRTHEVGRLYRSLAESRQSAGGTRRK